MTATLLTITWSTNFNGVWVSPEYLTDEQYDIVESINNEMELASMTYDMCEDQECFEDPVLSSEQVETIKNVVRNNERLKNLFGEFEVNFEIDSIST